MDQPEGHRVGQLHKQPVISHIGDDRGEHGLLFLRRLPLKEFEQFHLLRLALGFRAVLLGQAEVLRQAFHAGDVVAELEAARRGLAQVFDEVLVEDAVDHEIGVAPDGRREVGVVLFGQAVVAVCRRAVDRLAQTAQELRPQGVALRVRFEDVEQSRNLAALG